MTVIIRRRGLQSGFALHLVNVIGYFRRTAFIHAERRSKSALHVSRCTTAVLCKRSRALTITIKSRHNTDKSTYGDSVCHFRTSATVAFSLATQSNYCSSVWRAFKLTTDRTCQWYKASRGPGRAPKVSITENGDGRIAVFDLTAEKRWRLQIVRPENWLNFVFRPHSFCGHFSKIGIAELLLGYKFTPCVHISGGRRYTVMWIKIWQIEFYTIRYDTMRDGILTCARKQHGESA